MSSFLASTASFDVRAPRLRRWSFFGLVGGTTLLGLLMMLEIVRAAGITVLEIVILALFVPTFAWISIAFWNAVVGFVLTALHRNPLSLRRPGSAEVDDSPIVTRTALVMPAHNEDPSRVMGGLGAMIRSLEATGQDGHFDIHLLSDTTDPEIAVAEEVAWLDLQSQMSRPERLHYRRRPENIGRKAGNIAEFCERWGDHYDFMVVLDADSVMSGATLVRLVRMMQTNARAGLIQTVPVPARQETLFGRFVQFAAAVYSPMLATGQAFWQMESANYWGHNAILRLRPFMDHCRLPVLPGAPPLGGAILSHDFVEAALMRRAGWLVYLVPELGGSYEEVPSNVPDYAKRDRRWAQGSLQHLRLLGEPGLAAMSRLHFTLGAMGYLSSVLWLLMLLASTAYVAVPAVSANSLGTPAWLSGLSSGSLGSLVPLLALTAGVLFLPKVLGIALALRQRRETFGGASALLISGAAEAFFAVVIAPLMMMYHTRFVAEILAGRNIGWGAQVRDGRGISWTESWKRTAGFTGLGVVWAGLTLYVSPTFFLWLTPIFAGLLFSAPLVRITSSASVGCWLRAKGILLVPAETEVPMELRVRREVERALGPGGAEARSGETEARGSSGLVGGRSGVVEPARPMGERNGRVRRTLPALALGAEPEVARGIVGAHARAGAGAGLGWEGGETVAEQTASRNMYQAERGLFDLRRGRPIFVSCPGDSARAVLFAAVEVLDDAGLQGLRRLGAGPLRLVVTPHRAGMMGVPRARPDDGGPQGVSFSLNGESPEEVYRMSSTIGRFDAVGLDARAANGPEAAGLALTRLGRLLPAAVAVPADPESMPELKRALESGEILGLTASQIAELADTGTSNVEVTYVSDAPVPLEEAENVRFMLFREANGLLEHVAILIGDQAEWPDPVPVRLHSACLTGDLFGSLRCDCGEQLRGSLRVFAANGGGVLLYLEQEGRGIGLGNKLRAYALQQQGLDTVDADCVLGFGADERRYDSAVEMLRQLGVERVQLLTNNPEKVKALEVGGIRVLDRQPLHGTLNRHNLPYVRAKVQRAGHWLGDMLHGAFPGK